jgi:predicted lipid-binding transport protein (Tim44 family)
MAMTTADASDRNKSEVARTTWVDDWSAHPGVGRAWVGWVVAIIVIGMLANAVAQLAPTPNKGFAGGAGVLAMISIVAVGIERVIEAIWSFVTSHRSSWWPLSEISDIVDNQVAQLNGAARPVFDAALTELTTLQKSAVAGSDEAARIGNQLTLIQKQETALIEQITNISKLAKDNQRVALTTTATVQAVNRVDTMVGGTIPTVRAAFNDAVQVATGAVDLVAAFKDNPAKKLISLLLGALLGLLVAGFVGLDLFAAAGAPLPVAGIHIKVGDFSYTLVPYVGVALTGLVLGLGSNPTHQVVSYVTDMAKTRKTAQLGAPDVDAGDGAGGSAAPADQPPASNMLAEGVTPTLLPTGILAAPWLDHAALAGQEIRADLSGLSLEQILATGNRFALAPNRLTVNGRPIDVPADETLHVDLSDVLLRDLRTAPVAQSVPRVRPGSLNLARRR